MRYVIVITFALLLISCGDGVANNSFDGTRICIDSKKYINLTAGNDGQGFDENRDLLIVHYYESDELFDRLVSLYGSPVKNYNKIWISMTPIFADEIERYRSQSVVHDAFYLKNSFQFGKKELLENGFTKVYRRSEKNKSWQIFSSQQGTISFNRNDWIGECLVFSKYTECQTSEIYDERYLVKISFPENFVLHSQNIKYQVFNNIKNEILCG